MGEKELNLYGNNLFGEAIKPPSRGAIADNFVFPPFSVLDARQGAWQERKRMWLKQGIKSEVGRDAECLPNSITIEKYGKDFTQGTSIFDPVLCELLYKWFCPRGGQIIDPFAGGSVRGIVANMLGFNYWGCDLSSEQIAANIEQADELCGNSRYIKIKVSLASLRQQFIPCNSEYINNTCHGRCCQGTDGICVTIHNNERNHIKNLGGNIDDNGFLIPDSRGLCQFKNDNGFCNIHENGKPFGCAASPFTLNTNNTLVVRNRYRMLKCYRDEGNKLPVYEAHKFAFNSIFEANEVKRIIEAVNAGDDEFYAYISPEKYRMLVDNDMAKNNSDYDILRPELEWINGDSTFEVCTAPKADYIFSCPPYGDLEKYSDHPADISNMNYADFLKCYRRIILHTVSRLKTNSFASFVVGDFRDKDGYYRNFVSDTIAAFLDAGLKLYNEAILVTPTGSLPIRITRQFNSGRKFGKGHQNILVFINGDWKKAVKKLEDCK